MQCLILSLHSLIVSVSLVAWNNLFPMLRWLIPFRFCWIFSSSLYCFFVISIQFQHRNPTHFSNSSMHLPSPSSTLPFPLCSIVPLIFSKRSTIFSAMLVQFPLFFFAVWKYHYIYQLIYASNLTYLCNFHNSLCYFSSPLKRRKTSGLRNICYSS